MTNIPRRGLMLVLSSPSGAGKTSITRAVLAQDPNLTISVSVTTRAQRPGEIDGTHYHFIDQATFDAMVRDDALLEYARVFGNSYGTPRAPVEAALAAGRDVIFDIDWQGTQQLHQRVRDDLVGVFVLPPTVDDLEKRLRVRAQDSDAVIASRMAKASDEMSHWPEYDYAIVNDDLATSIAQIQAILTAERLRRSRQTGLPAFVRALQAKL
ncbi:MULTISPECIES: guanylate kinase [Inquilinus]|uniref:Guanylate kinase n=1 Tax=Inquilinus ginsengisoli TaxID=363840 RepID=A0ABU1JW39_9PROT|nr:guanylate kinase [Inquilinus ginsengisoli]MDR6292820.1 guanylate kinase [Inquilinus ginsengisoli]